jgi:hypothetical protein
MSCDIKIRIRGIFVGSHEPPGHFTGSQRPRPHGGSVEPRSDAGQALSCRGRAAGQRRAPARASGAAGSIGAVHVCDSSAPSFKRDLRDALSATSATLAFDATGGGNLASQILNAMEASASQSATEYSRYGSTVRKQVYIYGGLDPSPTILNRTFGFAWNVGGWLLTPFLQSIGPERFGQLRQIVAAGLMTTFASSYSSEISLAQVLDPSVFSQCLKQSTGAKVLVNPQLDRAGA